VDNSATISTPKKQTTLGSFANFAKHAKTLSEIKQKKSRVTTPKKQTTLGSFAKFARHAKTLCKQKAE